MAKNLYQLEAKLGGYVNQSLAKESSTASILCVFTDSDDSNSLREPDPDTKLFEIDPQNTQGKKSEYILCESHSTTNGITTLVNVTRGLQRDGTVDLTGSADRAQQWSSPPIGVVTEPFNLNYLRKMMLGEEQVPELDIAGTLEVDGITKLNDQLQLSNSDTYMDKVGDDLIFKDPNNPITTLSELTAAAGVDNKVRASLTDITSGVLTQKIAAGNGVSLEILNPGGDEQLSIGFSIDSNYGIDSSGTDTYVVTLDPVLPSYEDGSTLSFEAGTSNTGPATVNFNSKGALPIITGDYLPLVTNAIKEDQKVFGQVSVKAVTFTAGLALAATSGTLTGNWTYKTGVYSVEFSNGDRRDVTLTKGATSATWSGGLSGAATANAFAQWFVMHTPSNNIEGGTDGSNEHWHDPVINYSLSRRNVLTGLSTLGTASGGTVLINNGGVRAVTTQAANNAIAKFASGASNYGGVAISVHNRMPSFRVPVSINEATAQEVFIGWVDSSIVGTSLENSVMTLDHFGFIVEDGTLWISIANGTTQKKTNISGLVADVTGGMNGLGFEGYFDGTTATFKVSGASVGTLTGTEVPDGNLNTFMTAVIADASGAAKTIRILENGLFGWNES